MFTGLVEELATVKAIYNVKKGKRLEITAKKILEDIELGASIAVNGCCLTVVDIGDGYCGFDVVQETFDLTCLENLKAYDRVNLERCLTFSTRLGGHIVQGHVDGVGCITQWKAQKDGSIAVSIEAPQNLLRYIVKKGSIAIDGISLTVTSVDDKSFSIALIPHTASVTTLGFKKEASLVNLEVDLIAKYVEKLHCGSQIETRSANHE
ncbi:MAG: riboflavin synthase [Chlamydiales bacterium]|jgi:riboflavin synthase